MLKQKIQEGDREPWTREGKRDREAASERMGREGKKEEEIKRQ